MKRSFFDLILILSMVCSCRSLESRLTAYPEIPPGGGAEPDRIDLSSSVTLLGVWDYEIKKDGSSRCLDMVDKATSAPHSNRILNFVPTYYFIVDRQKSAKETVIPQSSTGQQSTLELVHAKKFCVLTDAKRCEPLGPKTVQGLRAGLTRCFARAIERGAGIVVTPHLDDGERRGQWRNTVIFDPFPHEDRDCRGRAGDYYCGFLKPIAESLHAVRRPDTPVYMSTQGEMGATVFAFPGKHGQLVRILRQIILGVTSEEGAQDSLVRTGVNLNFNETFGLIPPKNVDPKGVQFLLGGSTYLGISAYAPLRRDQGEIRPWRFNQNFEMFNRELLQLGINLRWYKNLELHLSEVGLGGSPNGEAPAKNDLEALGTPYYGIHGPYEVDRDPWQSPALKKTRFDYHCALLNYLAKPSLQTWSIKHAFLWNLASWDVQGLYPSSSGPTGSYADARIANMIGLYNRTGTHSCPWYERRYQEGREDDPAEELQRAQPDQAEGRATDRP